MKFEEQFPSLKGKEYYPIHKFEAVVSWTGYRQEEIQKHCLDKAKVREAIDKHFVHGFTGDGTVHSSACRMCKVLKELGL